MHPETLEAPAQGPADGAQSDEAGGAPGQLPRPVPLVGDAAVLEDLVGPHVVVGRQRVASGGEEQGDGQLRHGVGVAPGRPEHGDASRGGGGDVDVVGVAAARADGPQGEVEHGAVHEVGLDDEHVGAFFLDTGGQLLAVVDAQGLVVDPRVEDDVGQLAQGVEAFAPEGRGDERLRSVCHGQP